jgi:4-oxalocrotonate tautomerase
MWEGRSVEQKRALVTEVTAAVCRTIDCTPGEVRVLIDNYGPENWAIGGKLRADTLGS